TRRTPSGSRILQEIVSHYLRSGDFNGISVGTFSNSGNIEPLDTLKHLIEKGDVEAYSTEDTANPHIKRFPAAPIPRQIGYLEGPEYQHVCLYPSVKHMRRVLPGKLYRDQPFTRRLALGQVQLQPVFFNLGVLERYQSDPRYIFKFEGLDGHISVKSNAYRSREMGQADWTRQRWQRT